jgi:aspartate racemase
MNTLGLIGGTSWRSTAHYYGAINQAVNDLYGDNTNPPLVLINLNQKRIHQLQTSNRWEDIAALLVDAAHRLQAAGAQAAMFCANTPHKVYAAVAGEVQIPLLHIGDATGEAVRSAGITKVGLIGTMFTMRDPFMKDWLRSRYEIETIVPETPQDQAELDRIAREELGMGIFRPAAKDFIMKQITALTERGARGVILGCTEFPLMISQSDLPIAAFDTMSLHARMAVAFVTGPPLPARSSR